jgi:hypothetical protein
MTDPSEVNISDAELDAARAAINSRTGLRQALSAFLARRVPDALPDDGMIRDASYGFAAAAHNKLRTCVLNGPKG